MRFHVALIVSVLLAAASRCACAQTILAPVADAYVRDGGSASQNFGKATTLQVDTASKAGSNYDSYLKFDLKAVPPFAQARLRLFAGLSATGSVTTTVYAVPVTSWSETAITWNNKPARGAVIGSATVKSKTFAWIEVDLTGYLLSERAQGRSVVSVALHSTANTTALLKANSKEASSNKPQLAFTVDKAPAVSLSAPIANGVFAAPARITLAASVSDPDGTIARVEFLQDANVIGTATSAPYTFDWSNVPPGRYALAARATDNSGVSTTSAAVNVVVDALPSVSLTAPANGSRYRASAQFDLIAAASDSDGSIAKVEFYQSGALIGSVTRAPYKLAWRQDTPGTYAYSAKATDNDGQATQSSAISLSIVPDAPPTISLTAPTDGSTLRAPASITLSASANDTDGSIVRVEFYQNGALLGSATQAPYSLTIDQSTPGIYAYFAKAIDDAGVAGQSSSVTVTVSALPSMYYIHTDQTNTPRMVTDQANRVVWRWDTADPFGASLPDEDADGDGTRFTLNLRFPGQYFDRETGLHYNYFRNYDPSTGRYIQSDPIGLSGGVNTYAYVDADPVSGDDPYGLFDPQGSSYVRQINPLRPTGAGAGLPWIIPVGVGIAAALWPTSAGEEPNPVVTAPPSPVVPKTEPLTREQEIEKDADHDLYKWRCDRDIPPPGLDTCQHAKWQLDRARQCKEQIERWDAKWKPGRHAQKIQETANRIRKWERAVERACGAPAACYK
jgi:RHS repeat-associated protein